MLRGARWLYRLRVGLEVHVQVASRSKLFSRAPVAFDLLSPNSHVNLFDAATPGTLPVLNSECLRQAVRLCLALGGRPSPVVAFDRKHYFYADLPHGFQITQRRHPIASEGSLFLPPQEKYAQIRDSFVPRSVPISKIQLEMDTAKSLYDVDPQSVYVDYNRAGIALLEIVTPPSLDSGEEAAVFVRTLQNLLQSLGVSKGTLEEGAMRCDVNVSLHPMEDDREVFRPGRTEIKNLNSLRSVQRAVQFEADRHLRFMEEHGAPVANETRGYNPSSHETEFRRSKTTEYVYLPEPNLPEFALPAALVESCQRSLPELPQARIRRYIDEYGLSPYIASLVGESDTTRALFEALLRSGGRRDAMLVGNWLVTELIGKCRKLEVPLESCLGRVAQLGELLESAGSLSGPVQKAMLERILSGDERPVSEMVRLEGLSVIDDRGELESLVETAVGRFVEEREAYLSGSPRVLKFFMGQIMKETRGRAEPKTVQRLLEASLARYR